jgi:small subunit ribosomal protein S21
MSKKLPIVSVQVRKGDINKALKIFKRRTIESGHLMELRERRYYKKPTTVKRREKQVAVRKNQKEVILAKIEDGNTKLRLYTKKPKGKGKKNDKNKNNQKKDK